MNDQPVYVGLDYHQSGIQVSVVDAGGRELLNRRCENDAAAVVRIVRGMGRVRRAALESCCGAADLAEELVQGHDWSVHLAHPGFVRRMKMNPDKTDLGDARLLADLTRVGYLPRVWLPPAAVREIRLLVRHRQQLADERRAAKLRIRAVLREQRVRPAPETGRPWSRPWVAWLREGAAGLSEQGRWIVEQHLLTIDHVHARIAAAEARLEAFTRDDPTVRRLRAERGIGPVTAWWLRAEIGRFDRFDRGKQLSRFCGVSPRNVSSGERQAEAGLVKAGNPRLRAILIEAGHRLIMHDPRWRAFAGRLRRRGKPGSVIAAAVANRWLRWLHHRMQEEVTPAAA